MKRLAPCLALALLFVALPARAQDHWSIELSSAAATTTQELGGADLGTGLGLEATVSYRFLPHLAAYAGWGWHHFGADESFAGSDIDFEETGYTFGLRFAHPIRSERLAYFVQAGGLYDHIEVEDGGDIVGDSGHGLGWQLGTGLVYQIAPRWQLVPSLRYRSLSREVEIGEVTTETDLSYFAYRIGIARTF